MAVARRPRALTLVPFVVALLVAASARPASPDAHAPSVAAVRVERARANATDPRPGEWPAPGRDSAGSYYSPLDQINAGNVHGLGLAWQYTVGGHHTLESTPIVVDGTLYATGNWGLVVALDAVTGRRRWAFDPYEGIEIDRRPAGNVVNRGVVVGRGAAYVVSYDCRVHALDLRTGTARWTVDTKEDPRYFCTGAPLIAGDQLVIGNGGSDVGPGGLRGYVSAYALDTGALRWRTYLVPKLGDADPPAALVAAASTWDPDRDRRYGGGGTAWNALAYDGGLDRVFVGTGNAAPTLSPRSKAGRPLDRLYAASIVALEGRTGRIAWHYQATPGDVWDYDAAAPLVLARLPIGGRERRVLLQANKNGYFYVLDRVTGAPLSAAPYVYTSWSSGLDANFRPIVPDNADDGVRWHVFYPGTLGAHAWTPMAFSPKTGLVYIPAVDTPLATGSRVEPATAAEPLAGDTAGRPRTARRVTRGVLKAWDPARQRLAWEAQTSPDTYVIQGGTLATGGNLVVGGCEDGRLTFYAADTGQVLKVIESAAATVAAPMTYAVDGTQYIAVMQGQGGHFTYALESRSAPEYLNEGRLLVLKLGGAPVPKPAVGTTVAMPAYPATRRPEPRRPAAVVAAGAALFDTWCTRCHTPGPSASPTDRVPLLAGYATREIFTAIVLEGALVPRGMPRFDEALTAGEAETLRGFVLDAATSPGAEGTAVAPRH